jgi:adenylate cyclase
VSKDRVSRIPRQELIARAGVDAAVVDRLDALGILVSDEQGRFAPSDVYRARLVEACERAGMSAEAIARAIDEGTVSLSFLDLPHYRWAPQGSETFAELADRLDLPLELVQEVSAALGPRRPDADDRIREDDETVFGLMRLAAPMVDADALVRTGRVYVDGLRRIVEAEASLFDTYFVRTLMQVGMTHAQAVDQANVIGAEVTPFQEAMVLALYRRQQERRWTEYTVEGIEQVVEEMGLYRRPARPPAFAFVDLTGYTRLTDERGDEAGARIASEMGSLVDRVAGANEGVPVKWLGDGVMVSFRDPGPAVRATLEMIERAPSVGLPAHGGVAAGPVVVQDGDYFGRTVNLASRIAGGATAGQTLVSELVAELADGEGLSFVPVGPVELKGFAEPVVVYEASLG